MPPILRPQRPNVPDRGDLLPGVSDKRRDLRDVMVHRRPRHCSLGPLRKGTRMKRSSSALLSSLVIATILSAENGQAAAKPRAACDVLSLAEVRDLVGAPVSVFSPS